MAEPGSGSHPTLVGRKVLLGVIAALLLLATFLAYYESSPFERPKPLDLEEFQKRYPLWHSEVGDMEDEEPRDMLNPGHGIHPGNEWPTPVDDLKANSTDSGNATESKSAEEQGDGLQNSVSTEDTSKGR